jgi:hypothetical protein
MNKIEKFIIFVQVAGLTGCAVGAYQVNASLSRSTQILERMAKLKPNKPLNTPRDKK